jgi:hypothetical protein
MPVVHHSTASIQQKIRVVRRDEGELNSPRTEEMDELAIGILRRFHDLNTGYEVKHCLKSPTNQADKAIRDRKSIPSGCFVTGEKLF